MTKLERRATKIHARQDVAAQLTAQLNEHTKTLNALIYWHERWYQMTLYDRLYWLIRGWRKVKPQFKGETNG